MKQMMKKTVIHPVAIGLVFNLTPDSLHYTKLKDYCIQPLTGSYNVPNSIYLIITIYLLINLSPLIYLDVPIDCFRVTPQDKNDIVSTGDSLHNSNGVSLQSPHKNAKPVPDNALPDLVKV